MTGELKAINVSAIYGDNATMDIGVTIVGEIMAVHRETGNTWRQSTTERVKEALRQLDAALRDAAGIIPTGPTYMPGAEGGRGSAGTNDKPQGIAG